MLGGDLTAAVEGLPKNVSSVNTLVPQGEVGFVVGALEGEGEHWSPLSKKVPCALPRHLSLTRRVSEVLL